MAYSSPILALEADMVGAEGVQQLRSSFAAINAQSCNHSRLGLENSGGGCWSCVELPNRDVVGRSGM